MKDDFARRSRVNPSFSLRSYAKFLGMHPSTLSQVLKGNRPLPQKFADAVLQKLNLELRERSFFKQSLKSLMTKQILLPEDDDRFLLDETYSQIIAEWEHYAVLTLFDCDDFNASSLEIQTRLGLTKSRAEVVLANLVRYGLLKKSGDTLKKSHSRLKTTEDVASQALRKSHRETLELGMLKLEEVEVELRDFSSILLAIDLEKIPEAKLLIRDFRKNLAALFNDGKRTEVYQIAIQMYPVTEKEKS